ncbi:hypothetical protein HU200_056244 [Digitaria exilis]|uniref:MATH domain-containing protein n=1 Tax=Digitaria exilis TaxID=1010633 RepID=A0A835E5I6_9POAL|nr:hypothetical protein HU200_056244 [Digitaria exilis]
MSSAALTKKTASGCTTEAARGEHVFKIVGYSLKRGLGVGKFVRSRTFSVGGYDWAIRFYPEGLVESVKDCVSVYLELMSENAEARACYGLRLIYQTNRMTGIEYKSPRLFRSSDNTRRFGPRNPRFVLRTELEKNCVRDDCLAIKCNIAVVKESQLSDIKVSYEIEVPPCDIPEHFAELALLRFVYTGLVHGMGDDLDGDDYKDTIWHLLAAADRYAVDRLKLMCQSILSKNLSMKNVAATLALADQHNCDKLKEVCIEFITMEDMNALVSTQGYANLKRACPSVFADILERTSRRRKN